MYLIPLQSGKNEFTVITDTDSLLLGETHDIHGLHGLFIHFIILLAGDLNVARTQEAVITEGLQKKLL